jgi:hypothetical protein
MNTYFRIDNPADVRIIDDATITAWESTSNPKLLLWAQQPPVPSLTARWVDGSWTEPVPTVIPRWVDFSAAIMSLPAINVMLGAVLQSAPGLYGGLVVGLQNASEGDSRVFLNSWNAAHAMRLLSAELIITVQEIAAAYELPEEFIDALAAYQMVRARNEDGTFMADDPATPDVDEAWVNSAVE